MKIQIETLGCKMNYLDSQRIGNHLQARGFFIVDKDADFVIVNTCTVTDKADKKSRIKIKNYSQNNQKVVITGCGAKIGKAFWQEIFPQCFLCPTPKEVVAFFEALSVNSSKISENNLSHNRTRKFVSIQNGCDTYCAYCIVPFVRGKSRNRSAENIIQEIRELEKDGIKEVVLTGINLAAWGASLTTNPEASRFPELLHMILDQTSIPRIRISSVGAQFLNDEFFEMYQNPRICDHLHISIQSGSETILHKMNRGHGTKEIIHAAEKAKKIRPHTALTCDIIVGFPGETAIHFQESVDLVQNLQLAKLHVFPFSPRKGTVAATMPDQISEAVKKERSIALRKIGDHLRSDFYRSQIGLEQEVLFEHDQTGLTTNFIRVRNPGVPGNALKKMKLKMEDLSRPIYTKQRYK